MTMRLDRSRDLGPCLPKEGDDRIVCRCEEVTQGEIRQAVHDGMFTMAEIRRYLRCGMGLCQGQTCAKLVSGIVARELGIRPGELKPASSRAPMRPLEMSIWADEQQAPGEALAGDDAGKAPAAVSDGKAAPGMTPAAAQSDEGKASAAAQSGAAAAETGSGKGGADDEKC